MDIEIPHKIAENFGLDENSIVELTEKSCNPTLDRLLAASQKTFSIQKTYSILLEAGRVVRR